VDRAYQDDQTRQLVQEKGYRDVVPPTKNRIHPWDYDKKAYKRRNEIERLFRRIKDYRRLFCRYDKLDVVFLGFLNLMLVHTMLRSVNTP